MASTITFIDGLGHNRLKLVQFTSVTTSRQAAVVGKRVLSAVGANLTDATAFSIELNTDADGNTSNGSVAVTNGDSGADSIDIWVLAND